MGRNNLLGMIEMTENLDSILHYHLTCNHYPPVSTKFIPVCKRAIKLANMNLWERKLILPTRKFMPVYKIIEGLHLHDLVNEDNCE